MQQEAPGPSFTQTWKPEVQVLTGPQLRTGGWLPCGMFPWGRYMGIGKKQTDRALSYFGHLLRMISRLGAFGHIRVNVLLLSTYDGNTGKQSRAWDPAKKRYLSTAHKTKLTALVLLQLQLPLPPVVVVVLVVVLEVVALLTFP